MTKIFLDADQSQIDNLVKKISLSKAVLNEISKTAIEKTLNWVKETAIVEIEERTKVPKSILSERAKTYLNNAKIKTSADATTGKAWFGTYRVSFIRMGAKQEQAGVQAGGTFLKSAFIAKLREDSSEGVYKRKGKGRFPIISQKKTIDNDVENAVKSDILTKTNEKLIEYLEEGIAKWESTMNS